METVMETPLLCRKPTPPRALPLGGTDPLSLPRYTLQSLTDPQVVSFRNLLLSIEADRQILVPSTLTPLQLELANEQLDKTKDEVIAYLRDAAIDALSGMHDDCLLEEDNKLYHVYQVDGVPVCMEITAD